MVGTTSDTTASSARRKNSRSARDPFGRVSVGASLSAGNVVGVDTEVFKRERSSVGFGKEKRTAEQCSRCWPQRGRRAASDAIRTMIAGRTAPGKKRSKAEAIRA